MTLTVRDTARLLNVSEKTVYRWISDRGLPAHRIGDQYRLGRAELLEWVSANRPEAALGLSEEPEEEPRFPSLEGALRAGGIVYRVEGRTRAEVLASAASVTRRPEGVSAELLLGVLQARERLAPTALGGGLAVPHPRHPLALHVTEPSITLCFLEHPVDFGALDGEPVFALFVLLSPSVRTHLHLLARVAFALRQPAFARAVREQAGRNVILEESRRVDGLCRLDPVAETPVEPGER